MLDKLSGALMGQPCSCLLDYVLQVVKLMGHRRLSRLGLRLTGGRTDETP